MLLLVCWCPCASVSLSLSVVCACERPVLLLLQLHKLGRCALLDMLCFSLLCSALLCSWSPCSLVCTTVLVQREGRRSRQSASEGREWRQMIDRGTLHPRRRTGPLFSSLLLLHIPIAPSRILYTVHWSSTARCRCPSSYLLEYSTRTSEQHVPLGQGRYKQEAGHASRSRTCE